MLREELGQIVNRARSRQQETKITWDELDENQKESDRLIGEAVQRAVLEEFKGNYISAEEDGIRVLGQSHQIPDLLKLIDENLPEFSYERPHTINLFQVVRSSINKFKFSETNTLAKFKSFKEDVLVYLRAMAFRPPEVIALIAETAGNASTHKEKDIRLRGMIAQIETAIQKIRDEQEQFTYSHWQVPDLFRSDYPVRRYVERIRELEVENRKLKGEPLTEDEERIF